MEEREIYERVAKNKTLVAKALRLLVEQEKVVRTGSGKRGDPYLYQKAPLRILEKMGEAQGRIQPYKTCRTRAYLPGGRKCNAPFGGQESSRWEGSGPVEGQEAIDPEAVKAALGIMEMADRTKPVELQPC